MAAGRLRPRAYRGYACLDTSRLWPQHQSGFPVLLVCSIRGSGLCASEASQSRLLVLCSACIYSRRKRGRIHSRTKEQRDDRSVEEKVHESGGDELQIELRSRRLCHTQGARTQIDPAHAATHYRSSDLFLNWYRYRKKIKQRVVQTPSRVIQHLHIHIAIPSRTLSHRSTTQHRPRHRVPNRMVPLHGKLSHTYIHRVRSNIHCTSGQRLLQSRAGNSSTRGCEQQQPPARRWQETGIRFVVPVK